MSNRLIDHNVWAEDDRKQAHAWRVHVKGNPKEGYEISIIRADNYHGFRSYGWSDRNHKRIIAEANGQTSISERAFNTLIRDAHEMANNMNEREGVD